MKNTIQAVFLFFLVSTVCAQSMGANYEVIANAEGDAFVFSTFNGQGSILIQLPSDVDAPYVRGGMYSLENEAILLSVTGDRMVTVSYRTKKLVTQTGNDLSFSLDLPENLSNTYVSVALPKEAIVTQVTPADGVVMSEDDSVIVAWASSKMIQRIKVDYRFSDDNGGGKPIDNGSDDNFFQLGFFGIVAVAGFILFCLIILIAIAFMFLRRKPLKEKPREESELIATEGMRNLMKALNENDVKIIQSIIDSSGEIKRNELERKSGIAKSSLALSLDRLEKKGILKINKETTTHYISLTEWFRSL